MSDDPFFEPNEESTVIRPRPRGSAGGSVAAQNAASTAPAPITAIPHSGVNKLAAAAAPLLAATTRIAALRGRAPDAERLRRGMVDAVREFEREALATGLDTRSLRAARYALCATIDDLVLSTPWGAHSVWAQGSLVSMFHNEVTGGERFFDILEQMGKDLGRHGEVVELMFLCIALGFEGRYRVQPRGVAALAELRDGLFRTIRNRRGEFERELSPHWRGIDTGHRKLAQRVPLWLYGVGALAIAGFAYLLFSFSLAAASDVPFNELAALPPQGPIRVARAEAVPPPPRQPATVTEGGLVARLHQFLAPEIRAGLVEVLSDPQTVTVRLANRNMFGSGSATLNPDANSLLGRIGTALQDEQGDVLVRGYTDNQPIRTARFPSNFQLSEARAAAVAALVRARLSNPGRVHVEGRGEADPITANDTAAGRQQNRRTEVVLMRAASPT